MSIVSVQPKSFILALFIRDDGERFLLGDNGYDFKDSQLHFAANTIENDEVQKQGADGVMVAGQVRRASVQSFDGYVGDATMAKETIEQMRRDFIAFFLKGHHYRVIYVDCNRNAWQRKGGYIVDAPEVKELWQIHPEYHVGLNFEDVNYYSYDEDADGNEILANLVNVPVSTEVSGGLVWDEDGAVSEDAGDISYDEETADATPAKNVYITDATEAPIASFKLDGETSQNGTPTPSAPVAVQTVSGENVVKICGKNLFDVANAQMTVARLNSTGNITTGPTNRLCTLGYIEVKPNTAYTLSATPEISGKTLQAYIVGYSESGLETSIGNYPSNAWYVFPITFTTGSNCKYIRVSYRYSDDSDMAATSATNQQLELGSSATTYEPYQEQSYEVNLGNIELCKIGDYQDYIYKNGGKWYVHKEVDRKVLDGSEYWELAERSGSNNGVFYIDYSKIGTVGAKNNGAFSNYARFISGYSYLVGQFDTHYSQWRFYAPNNTITLNEWKTNLGATPLVLYYLPATPTDTEITNEALIEQLEALLTTARTYAGVNNIFTITPNEQGTLEISYYTKYQPIVGSGGYVWEAGGAGGPTVIMNNSIDRVSPVWTIYGPTTNPQLENATTGETIEYVGMIAEGQTLTIDMGEQTASLDGLNVISNLVGDFIQLAPGRNNIIYSVSGEAGASELGWSEIVG